MAFPSGGSDAVSPPRLIFITGTDTGVGKTLLTGLLLAHLRQRGQRAFALKPFCSGTRAEVRLLRAFPRIDVIARGEGEQTAPSCSGPWTTETSPPCMASRFAGTDPSSTTRTDADS